MTPEQITKLQEQIKKGIAVESTKETKSLTITITPKDLLEIGNRANEIFNSYKGFKHITASQTQVAIIIEAFNNFLPQELRLSIKFEDSDSKNS